jgi:putative heme-binding domain-containing protein
MRVLGERKELAPPLERLVLLGMEDDHALVRRCAVEALGTHPSASHVPSLIASLQRCPKADSHLRHAIRIALRNQFREEETWAVVQDGRCSASDRLILVDIMPGIPQSQAAEFVLRNLKKGVGGRGSELASLVEHVARYAARPAALDELIELIRVDDSTDRLEQVDYWKAMQRGSLARGERDHPAVRAWGEMLVQTLLAGKRDKEIIAGLELAGMLKLASIRPTLREIVQNAQASEGQRLAGLAALAVDDSGETCAFLGEVLADGSAPTALRERAASLLAGKSLESVPDLLIQSLPGAPERLALVIANGLANTRPGADRLLDCIAGGKASPRLLQDSGVQIRLNKSNTDRWRDRVAELTHGLPTASERMDRLIAERRKRYQSAVKDLERGAAVFMQHCASCHQVANHGAKIGPQLDGIGARGFDRVLEDIMDPHRNVDQAFRATTLGLSNGQALTGLVLREEGETIVLADSQGKEIRVAKKDIEERAVSALSPMPSNLLAQMDDAELTHLMAFLLNQSMTEQRPARER